MTLKSLTRSMLTAARSLISAIPPCGVVVSTLLAFQCPVQAATAVRWAGAAHDDNAAPVPGMVGAPDAVIAAPSWRASQFGSPVVYANLAPALGLSEAVLGTYSVIAWESNGGSPALAGGWESSEWTYDDGVTSLTAVFNELTGTAVGAGMAFLTGSITGAQYNALYGTAEPSDIVWSWLLAAPVGIDVHSPAFSVRLVAVGGLVGLGEGSPDPDAIGLLSPVPEMGSFGLMAAGLMLVFGLRSRYPLGDLVARFAVRSWPRPARSSIG